eukprot:c16227_g1_i3.p1 GENE.c16227_g1_i3~~c16227_g1_i3.p1  ORF type:complete len:293 (-),score=28.98 c16227_g1_i3:64-942(-)
MDFIFARWLTATNPSLHRANCDGLRAVVCAGAPINLPLRRHMRTHTEVRLHPVVVPPDLATSCAPQLCDDESRDPKGIASERNFQCSIDGCNKAYTAASSLKSHIRTHTGERPYVCDVGSCCKTFPDSGSLRKHSKTHQSERPHTCEEQGCGKTFKRLSNLTQHARTHSRNRPREFVSTIMPVDLATAGVVEGLALPDSHTAIDYVQNRDVILTDALTDAASLEALATHTCVATECLHPHNLCGVIDPRSLDATDLARESLVHLHTHVPTEDSDQTYDFGHPDTSGFLTQMN